MQSLQVLLKLRLPAALPYLFVGFKIAATASVIGTIVGELPSGIWATATIHPSAVLRARNSADRAAALGGLVADLRTAREELGRLA